MQEVMALAIGYGSLAGYYLLVMAAAALLVVTAVLAPRWAGLALVLLVVVFPNSASTAVAGEYGWNVFGKGQRYFFFSIVELLAMSLGLLLALHHWVSKRWVGLARTEGPTPLAQHPNPYAVFYFGFFLLVLGWALLDVVMDQNGWSQNFGRNGVWTLVVQGLFLSALVRLCTTEKLLFSGFHWMIVTVAGVVVYGLVRYVFLGGDPQGVYETDGSLPLRLSFWDINYLIFATSLGGWLLWCAADPACRRSWPWREALALLAFIAVALSARRSAQVGVLVTLFALALVLPRGKKLVVGVMIALTFAAVGYKLNQRIDDNRPLLTRLVQGDQRAQYLFDPRYGRYYELEVAWKDIRRNPVFGVGPANGFNPPSHMGLEYHRGNFGFVHSGFGHVLLKTGFVGLTLLLGLLLTYATLVLRLWRRLDHRQRGLLVFSGAGMLAFLPTLAIGTPFIELRTALTMGVLMALPLALWRLLPVPQAVGTESRSLPFGQRVGAGKGLAAAEAVSTRRSR